MLNIGKDLKSDEFVYLDDSRSRSVLVCGKRGSGKSYTLGVIVEELLDAGNTLVMFVHTIPNNCVATGRFHCFDECFNLLSGQVVDFKGDF